MSVQETFRNTSKNSSVIAGIIGSLRGTLLSVRRKKTNTNSAINLDLLRDPNWKKQKYWKPVLFVFFPFLLRVVIPHFSTMAIAMVGGNWIYLYLIWLSIGFAVSQLSLICAPENDKGLKWIIRGYILVGVYFIMGIIWQYSTGYNDFHIYETYQSEMVNTPQMANPLVQNATLSTNPVVKQDHVLITSADSNKPICKVSTGQVIHIVNEAGVEYSVVVDGVGTATSSAKQLKIPVRGNGKLRFKLPDHSTIRYYIDDV